MKLTTSYDFENNSKLEDSLKVQTRSLKNYL